MKGSRLHLFQAYGIELEYMIVNKDTLITRPVTDELFKKVTGSYCSDVEQGAITWCNELVLHVVELKCTEPTHDLVQLEKQLHQNVVEVNRQLDSFGAKLLPTAAHPLMDPNRDTFLWPHDNNEVYERYNKIFNCKGHGWSNLQSMHINLPFYDDEEFAQLHAAVRLLLPILPAIAASSPILGGSFTGVLDKRMDYYQKNQRIIPSITGKVVPERAFSKRQYHKMIYDRITHDIAAFNDDGLLNPAWVNSRGAIARFDRGSIEIRVLDLQECPKADLAIASLVICLLKLLVTQKTSTYHDQQLWAAEDLNEILQKCIVHAEHAEVRNPAYLNLFGMSKEACTASELWSHLVALAVKYYPEEMEPWLTPLQVLLEKGTLASRIVKSLGGIYSTENITMIYQELSDCLNSNEMFEVWIEEEQS